MADAADRQYSYVVVTTKAIPELTKTSGILSPFLSKDYIDRFKQPTYVLMQNGLNVEVDLHNALMQLHLQGEILEKPNIISSALWIGTNVKAPNIVEHGNFVSIIINPSSYLRMNFFLKDRLILGAYRHNDYTTTTNTAEEEAILQDFGTMLKDGGSTVTVVPEIQRLKFAKNFWNLAFASFATLTR